MSTADKKDIIRAYGHMWNEHKPELAAQILANDYIDHAHPEAVGPKAIAESVRKTLQAMPDFHIEITSMIAEGDMVAFREFITIQRDGKLQRLEGMSFVRIRDDKMAERWTCYDRTGSKRLS